MIGFIKWIIATLTVVSLFSLLIFIIFVLILVVEYIEDNRIIAKTLDKMFKGK